MKNVLGIMGIALFCFACAPTKPTIGKNKDDASDSKTDPKDKEDDKKPTEEKSQCQKDWEAFLPTIEDLSNEIDDVFPDDDETGEDAPASQLLEALIAASDEEKATITPVVVKFDNICTEIDTLATSDACAGYNLTKVDGFSELEESCEIVNSYRKILETGDVEIQQCYVGIEAINEAFDALSELGEEDLGEFDELFAAETPDAYIALTSEQMDDMISSLTSEQKTALTNNMSAFSQTLCPAMLEVTSSAKCLPIIKDKAPSEDAALENIALINGFCSQTDVLYGKLSA